MIIEFSPGKSLSFAPVDVVPGTSLEQLYQTHQAACPHTAVAAILDHQVVPLSTKVEKECRIQLLDIQNKQGYLIYQNSLILIFICAVRKIKGDVHVEIMTSLNDGIFMQVMQREENDEFVPLELSDDDVARTYFCMKNLVQRNVRIEDRKFRREEAIEMLKKAGLAEKYRNMQRMKVDETVRMYTLEDYSDFFYNYMVPSTGYADKFELMKYRDGILMRHPSARNPEAIPEYVDEYQVFNALKEQRRWNELLDIQYQADINDRILSGDFRTMVHLSEALHDKKIVEIADLITKEDKRVILILGPSSSGKTTFAHRLVIQLMVNGKKPLYIGTDDYFVEREETPLDADGERDYEDIQSVDLDLFNRQMTDLLAGKDVDMPQFNFETGHKEYGKRITRLEEDGILVIEGIHAFNHLLTDQLAESLKFRIYISPLTQINLDSHNRIPTTDTRVIRRLVRDYRSRGQNATMTLRMWPKVRASEDRNIFPYSNEADVFFNTVHVYEMAVLKKYVVPLLQQVSVEDEEYAEAMRLLRLFQYVYSLEDDSIIAGNSILREFIGGSTYGI